MFGFNLKTGELYFHKDGSRSLFYEVDKNVIASEPLGSIGNNWFPIENTKWQNLNDGLEYFTVNEEFKDATKKQSFTVKCDVCGKKSSNGVKIGTKDVCYSCLSTVDFNPNNLSKKDTTTTYSSHQNYDDYNYGNRRGW